MFSTDPSLNEITLPETFASDCQKYDVETIQLRSFFSYCYLPEMKCKFDGRCFHSYLYVANYYDCPAIVEQLQKSFVHTMYNEEKFLISEINILEYYLFSTESHFDAISEYILALLSQYRCDWFIREQHQLGFENRINKLAMNEIAKFWKTMFNALK